MIPDTSLIVILVPFHFSFVVIAKINVRFLEIV